MNPKVVKLFKVLYHLVVLVLIVYLYLELQSLTNYVDTLYEGCVEMNDDISIITQELWELKTK